jgi:hypothetical protein
VIPVNPGPPLWVSNVSVVAVAILLVAMIAALTGPSVRAVMRRHWIVSLLLWLIVLFASLPTFVYLVAAVVVPIRSAANYTRSHPATMREESIDGLTVPIGTRLGLLDPNDIASTDELLFDPPLTIRGVSVVRAWRWLGPGDSPAKWSASDRWYLSAPDADQHIAGWTCAGPAPIEVDAPLGGGRADADLAKGLRSCTLGQGNEAAGVTWMAGTKLARASCERGCAGGETGNRWLLTPPASLRNWLGFPVRGLTVTVDDNHALISSRAYLTAPVRLGTFTYLPYTRIQQIDGNLAFNPDAGAPAHRDDGTMVDEEHSVVQSRDGDVIAIVPTHDPLDLRLRHFVIGQDVIN